MKSEFQQKETKTETRNISAWKITQKAKQTAVDGSPKRQWKLKRNKLHKSEELFNVGNNAWLLLQCKTQCYDSWLSYCYSNKSMSVHGPNHCKHVTEIYTKKWQFAKTYGSDCANRLKFTVCVRNAVAEFSMFSSSPSNTIVAKKLKIEYVAMIELANSELNISACLENFSQNNNRPEIGWYWLKCNQRLTINSLVSSAVFIWMSVVLLFVSLNEWNISTDEISFRSQLIFFVSSNLVTIKIVIA